MDGYVVRNSDSHVKRLSILFIVIVLSLLSHEYLTPYIGRQIKPFIYSSDKHVRLFFYHLLIFTLPHFIVSILIYFSLVKLCVLKFKPDVSIRLSLKSGILFGLAISTFTILQWVIMGLEFQFIPDMWKISGNIFSNFYEETFYRLLMIPVLVYAFRSKPVALIISSAIFACTHNHYPLFIQFTVFMGGLCFGASFLHSKNILGPYIAHQLSDMILDTLLRV